MELLSRRNVHHDLGLPNRAGKRLSEMSPRLARNSRSIASNASVVRSRACIIDDIVRRNESRALNDSAIVRPVTSAVVFFLSSFERIAEMMASSRFGTRSVSPRDTPSFESGVVEVGDDLKG